MMSANCKISFKVLVIGEVGVGKTCLVRRFTDGYFTDQHYCTIGVGYKTSVLPVADQLVRLEIWDTAGEERFRSLMPAFYRGALGGLLVFDCTRRSAIKNVEYWLEEIYNNCPRDISILLVGNKCDELKKRVITLAQATHYAARVGIPFCEASAKSGVNVKDIFSTLAWKIYTRVILKPSLLRGSQVKPACKHNPAKQDKGGGDGDDSISLVDEKASGQRRLGNCC